MQVIGASQGATQMRSSVSLRRDVTADTSVCKTPEQGFLTLFSFPILGSLVIAGLLPCGYFLTYNSSSVGCLTVMSCSFGNVPLDLIGPDHAYVWSQNNTETIFSLHPARGHKHIQL